MWCMFPTESANISAWKPSNSMGSIEIISISAMQATTTYVPTDQVQLLQKYIGSEGEAPKLSRLGGTHWAASCRAAVADLARELIDLYARRSLAPGFAFLPDTPWQAEFEDSFPFEELPISWRLWRKSRRTWKSRRRWTGCCAAMSVSARRKWPCSGFQGGNERQTGGCARPDHCIGATTFFAQTFSSRFAAFGLSVDLVCRFRTPAEQRSTLQKTADGLVDVLIGTHRLLQSDVVFWRSGTADRG